MRLSIFLCAGSFFGVSVYSQRFYDSVLLSRPSSLTHTKIRVCAGQRPAIVTELGFVQSVPCSKKVRQFSLYYESFCILLQLGFLCFKVQAGFTVVLEKTLLDQEDKVRVCAELEQAIVKG